MKPLTLQLPDFTLADTETRIKQLRAVFIQFRTKGDVRSCSKVWGKLTEQYKKRNELLGVTQQVIDICTKTRTWKIRVN